MRYWKNNNLSPESSTFIAVYTPKEEHLNEVLASVIAQEYLAPGHYFFPHISIHSKLGSPFDVFTPLLWERACYVWQYLSVSGEKIEFREASRQNPA